MVAVALRERATVATVAEIGEWFNRLGLHEPTMLSQAAIRALRSHLDASREQLARVLQVSPQAVEGWERGANAPGFAPVMGLMVLELAMLAGRVSSSVYNPRVGLLGQLLLCGALSKEELLEALRNLASAITILEDEEPV